MNEKQISDALILRLKDYGAIKWHKNRNHSFYIKFRDTRLGSIRISNHKGRSRYSYTYELWKRQKNIEKKIDEVVESIIEKSKRIPDFDPEKYIVFDKEDRRYVEAFDFNHYKEFIFKKYEKNTIK